MPLFFLIIGNNNYIKKKQIQSVFGTTVRTLFYNF